MNAKSFHLTEPFPVGRWLQEGSQEEVLAHWGRLKEQWINALWGLLNTPSATLTWGSFKSKFLDVWEHIEVFYKNVHALQCIDERFSSLGEQVAQERLRLYELTLRKRGWASLIKALKEKVGTEAQRKILEDWSPGSPLLQKRAEWLNQKVLHFQSAFAKNIKQSVENKFVKISSEKLSGWGSKIPLTLRQEAKRVAQESGCPKEHWFALTDFSYSYIMRYCPYRAIRKDTYYLKYTLASEHQDAGYFDNNKVMRNIIAYRNKEAKAYGFGSSLQMGLHGNVLGTEQEVETFLTKLARIVKLKALEELKNLRAVHIEENACEGSVKAWDYAYLEQRLIQKENKKQSKANVNLSISKRKMLMLVKKAVFLLAHRFSLNVKEGMIYGNRGGVKQMYFSFFQGRGKEKKSIGNLLIIPFVETKNFTDSMPFNLDIRNAVFGEKAGGASVVCLQWEEKQLGFVHADLVHVFHELGHAFQNMLMRTKYKYQGIDSVPKDAIEVFSQFFERFAWERETLMAIGAQGWAKNMDLISHSQGTNKYLQLLNEVVQYLTEIKIHKNRALGKTVSVQAVYQKVRKDLFMTDYQSAYLMNQLRSFAGTNCLMEHAYLVSEAMAWELWRGYKHWERLGYSDAYLRGLQKVFFEKPGDRFWESYKKLTKTKALSPDSILHSREAY